MEPRRTALLTGASGFLGGFFARELLREELDVFAPGLAEATGARFVPWDMAGDTHPPSWEPAQEVFHLAGLAHRVPQSAADEQLFWRVNLEGTRNLLSALDRQAAPPVSFLLISTVAVYGRETGEGLDEETPLLAADAYGASKRAAEEVVREWSSQRGVRLTVFRLPLVVGRGAPGNLGRMAEAIRRRRYAGIGRGAARRSLVLAEDVARAARVASRHGGTYHLTDGRHPSFAEIEFVLAQAMGLGAVPRVPLWIARVAARAGDGWMRLSHRPAPFNSRMLAKMTSTLTFSDERARQVWGWNPQPVIAHLPELAG